MDKKVEYLYLGKIVGTHGIKGEIRLLSSFDKKEKVFVPGFKIYIGNEKQEHVITGYRKHKNFDMITLERFSNINEVLAFKGLKVYILKSDLNLKENEYVLDELIGMIIISNNKKLGVVKDIFDTNGNILLEISFEKNYYIPYNDRYIKSVNLQQKEIMVVDVEDLIL